MSGTPIIVERTFQAKSETIWQALTNPLEMKKWYFDIPEFEPRVGCTFQFIGENEGRTFLHVCEVKEAHPAQKLRHSWTYEGVPGYSEVIFELTPETTGTQVKLTHTGIETFPEDHPDLARRNFEIGWDYIINIGLQEYLVKAKASN